MIAGVVVALLSVALILVGLPLFAWWVGGRATWGRLKPNVEPDLYREMVRRHGLHPAEIAQVESAVTWGRELREERLRAAVVEWAQLHQATERQRRDRRPALRTGALLVFVAWGTFLLGYVVFAVAQGRWDDAHWSSVVPWLVVAAAGWLRQRGPARAVRLNRGPPPSTGG